MLAAWQGSVPHKRYLMEHAKSVDESIRFCLRTGNTSLIAKGNTPSFTSQFNLTLWVARVTVRCCLISNQQAEVPYFTNALPFLHSVNAQVLDSHSYQFLHDVSLFFLVFFSGGKVWLAVASGGGMCPFCPPPPLGSGTGNLSYAYIRL